MNIPNVTPLEWMDENEDEIWMNNQVPCELWMDVCMYVCVCCFSFLQAFVMLWMLGIVIIHP